MMKALVLTLFLLALSSCAKEADPQVCRSVCMRLSELLQEERSLQGLDEVDGLKKNSASGTHNIERCTSDCVKYSNEDQLECLKAVQNLEDWAACP